MGRSGQFHLLCLHIIAVVVVLSVVVVVGGRFPASRRLSVRHLSAACSSYLEPPSRAARGPLLALPRFLAQGGVASFGAPCLITHPRVAIDTLGQADMLVQILRSEVQMGSDGLRSSFDILSTLDSDFDRNGVSPLP